MAGSTIHLTGGSWDIWVLKLNLDGTIDWQKTYNLHTDGAYSIEQTFDLTGNPPVIFAGYTPKTHFIEQHRIQLYYGDSDTDVTEAQEAGIRVVRILRATISTDNRSVKVGGYGEEVLVGSDR